MILQMTDNNGVEITILDLDVNPTITDLTTQLFNLELGVTANYVKLILTYAVNGYINTLTIGRGNKYSFELIGTKNNVVVNNYNFNVMINDDHGDINIVATKRMFLTQYKNIFKGGIRTELNKVYPDLAIDLVLNHIETFVSN